MESGDAPQSRHSPRPTRATALQQFDPLWDELFPAEQARIIALAVERVEIGADAIHVRMRIDGLGELAQELRNNTNKDEAAA